MKNLEEYFDIKDKIIVVTGGYGYLGGAISKGLANIGAKVIIVGKNQEKGEEFIKLNSKNENMFFFKCDLRQVSNIESIFGRIYADIGTIDVLINNANFGENGKIDNMSDDDWVSGIEGTINNYFRCLQKSLNYIRKPGGRIINIASMYGLVSPDPSIYGDSGFDSPPNYGVGKAAIIQLTKYAAVHIAKDGINVNSISPGAFPSLNTQKNKEFISNLKNKAPLKRIGQPDELLGAIILLSSISSSFITGHNLVVDGGWTIW